MDAVKRAVLIGLLLGDLHLQKGDTRIGKCRMRISHQIEQKGYSDWIYNLFIDWCRKTKAPYKEENKKGHVEYLFYSEYREELIEYHNLFYKKPKNPDSKVRFVKKLPENLEELLTDPITLAVWYMDDGTKRSDCNAGRIATQGFTEDENIRLQKCVWKNHSIHMEVEKWQVKGKDSYGVSIPSRGGPFTKWCDLIRPFIEKEVPQMMYKLEYPKTP